MMEHLLLAEQDFELLVSTKTFNQLIDESGSRRVISVSKA